MSVRLEPTFRPGGYELRLLVDDVDLADLVRPIELPFAAAEGRSTLAGKYSGLHWRSSEDPSSVLQHYLGRPDPHSNSSYKGKQQILGCECGEPGCWPLICTIEADTRSVRWSDFQQYQRMGRPLPERLRRLADGDRSALPASMRGEIALREANSHRWTYDSFGPFVFRRAQYEQELLAALTGA